MKFTLLKTKLQHEIAEYFKHDAFYYITENKTKFEFEFEVIEKGVTYIIRGKYYYSIPIYKKDEIECLKWNGKECIPCELKILPVNYDPNKQSLLEIMDEIVEKEQEKIKERTRTERLFNRIDKIYGKKD